MSRKRAAQNRVRNKIRKEYADNQEQCHYPGCSRLAVDVHEVLTRARGGSITDRPNLMPLCREHHEWVGAEQQLAHDMGLLKHSWEKETNENSNSPAVPVQDPLPGRAERWTI